MRATFEIDERVVKAAEARAAATGRSLDAVVEEALREVVAAAPPRQKYPFPTFGKGGLQPGVDLNDSRAIRDLMDREDFGSR